MALMDEKGRLFGKINIIDFLTLLFIFCILPTFYFGYKIMAARPTKSPTMTIDEAKYECMKARLERLDEWLEENKKAWKYLK